MPREPWTWSRSGRTRLWPATCPSRRPARSCAGCSTPRSAWRSDLPGSTQLAGVLPALEVALELARDRLAARLGKVGGVLGLLEAADVLRDVLVLLGQLLDAALPGPGLLGEVAQRDGHLEDVLDLGEQGQGPLGARRLREVVRHGGPEGHCREIEPCARVL